MMEYAGEEAELDGYLTKQQLSHFRQGLPDECCAKCRFWDKGDAPIFDGAASEVMERPIIDDGGHCRRYPPQMIVLSDGDTDWICPWTSGQHRWCGEFQVNTE